MVIIIIIISYIYQDENHYFIIGSSSSWGGGIVERPSIIGDASTSNRGKTAAKRDDKIINRNQYVKVKNHRRQKHRMA